MSAPDVSCVITPGPGGAAALRTSVDSVLDQSLRAVEALVVLPRDADASVRAAAGTYAGRAPDRVRVLDTDAPGDVPAVARNAGLSAARGTYVLVLGDGERLRRHACRTLWEAGERTGAELVAGCWSRLTEDGAKEQEPPWQHALFPRSRVVTKLTDAPELVVRDALVTGFCLRRAALERFGARYDEDLGPGDSVFGARAAVSVGRIALVRRRIVSGRAAADPGRDLAGRVEAHRRIRELLEARGRAPCARSGNAPSRSTASSPWYTPSPRCPPPSATGWRPRRPGCCRGVSRNRRCSRSRRSNGSAYGCWSGATRTGCSAPRTRSAGAAAWPRRWSCGTTAGSSGGTASRTPRWTSPNSATNTARSVSCG